MKKAFVFLATGFEEMEAVGTVDILRRGGVDVTTVSVTEQQTVFGAHHMPVKADQLFDESDYAAADILILPGGGPGSQLLNGHAQLKELILQHNSQGKLIAAICAAPLVLGGLGLLAGKKAICYPGVEPQLTGAIITDQPTVKDGNIITGKGPGLVFHFGLLILETLQGKEIADRIAGDLLL
jgi:4-methyl-5(b-hydroxyethyl)-thiazole monophosphate biosynthesis